MSPVPAPRAHSTLRLRDVRRLAVFQQPQFLGEADVDMAVGADPEPAASGQEVRGVEDAVAEIGLGLRAEPGDGADAGQRFGFGAGHVRRVDGAPVPVHRQRIQQIFDRTPAAPGDAVIDFGSLFGDVDVDWAAACERQDLADLLHCGGAKRMGSDTDPGSWIAPHAAQHLPSGGRSCRCR